MRLGQLTTASVLIVGLVAGSTAAIAHDKNKHKKKRDVHVSAPYTKVDVDETVDVKAPYTRVKVRRGQVKVRAPYVNLNIQW